ncbi:expressed protein [Batrachochytrium dendrobatidis JAM81]|uniref:Expressed protein n=2 Tax=Batrachochytrium dendrobatidis TaxID=109871 RepID=F4NW74_BATDJ|nr:uncharacterized protein BATDEDRAFT_86234 [Batrachochytrium dendrobatidis JAM81]EGF82430.1 expressed protein [Batrachochytrium dendrobatidis JAM81]|eukprot:XP_006676923.1 expressed protein [Batrachochytrium dendrobatidis JAM81]
MSKRQADIELNSDNSQLVEANIEAENAEHAGQMGMFRHADERVVQGRSIKTPRSRKTGNTTTHAAAPSTGSLFSFATSGTPSTGLNDTTRMPFSFGTTESSKTQSSAGMFSFGASPKSVDDQSIPASIKPSGSTFSFGSTASIFSPPKNESSPFQSGFSFGSTPLSSAAVSTPTSVSSVVMPAPTSVSTLFTAPAPTSMPTFTVSDSTSTMKPKDAMSGTIDVHTSKKLEHILLQLRGLNASFLNQIQTLYSEDCFQDLGRIFDSYKDQRRDMIAKAQDVACLLKSTNDVAYVPATSVTASPALSSVGFKAPTPLSNSNGIQPFSFNATSSSKVDNSSNGKSLGPVPPLNANGIQPFSFGSKDKPVILPIHSNDQPKFSFGTSSSSSTLVESTPTINPISMPTSGIEVEHAKPTTLLSNTLGPVTSNDTAVKPLPTFSFGNGPPTFASASTSSEALSSKNLFATASNVGFTFGSGTQSTLFGSGTQSTTGTPFSLAKGVSGSDGSSTLFGNGNSSGFSFNTEAKPFMPGSGSVGNEVKDGEDEDAAPLEEQIGDVLMNGAGEEGEVTDYEVRAKLFFMGEKKHTETISPWVSKGIGILRIKRHKESSKCRLLMRADTVGHVLLNTAIYKTMPVTKVGENSVSLLVTSSESEGKLIQGLIRVKTAKMADEFIAAVVKAKAE